MSVHDLQCCVKKLIGAFIVYSLSFNLADLTWPEEQSNLPLLDICGFYTFCTVLDVIQEEFVLPSGHYLPRLGNITNTVRCLDRVRLKTPNKNFK